MVKGILSAILTLLISFNAFAENDGSNGTVASKSASLVSSAQTCLPGTDMFAVVNSAGTLIRATPGTRSVRSGTGRYTVTFPLVITRGGYQGTLASPASIGTEAPGMITITGRYAQPQALWVATYNSAGASLNRNFHISVHC